MNNKIEKNIIEIDVNEIAKEIAFEIMYEWDYINKKNIKVDRVDYNRLDKDCYCAISDIKNDIFEKAYEIIEKENISID